MGWRGPVARLAFVVGFFAGAFLVEGTLSHRVSAWWWHTVVVLVAGLLGNVAGYGVSVGVRRLIRPRRPETG